MRNESQRLAFARQLNSVVSDLAAVCIAKFFHDIDIFSLSAFPCHSKLVVLFSSYMAFNNNALNLCVWVGAETKIFCSDIG